MEVRELGSPWSADGVAGLGAGGVHGGGLFRDEFPAETLAALAEAGARLSFDGQGLVRPARSGPLVLEPEPELSLLRHISVLKLSEEEALALVGSLDEHSLSGLGVPEVVVTLGSRGCVLVAEHRLVPTPAGPPGVDPPRPGGPLAPPRRVRPGPRRAPRPAPPAPSPPAP